VTPDELAALTHRPTHGPFLTTVLVDGVTTPTLADLPPARDGLLFVGLAPDGESVEAGHHHQDRLGRTFWRRLMLAGILPPATPIDTADEALIAAGHGLTDLVRATDRPDGELRAGVGLLWQKIAIWRPAAIVFLDRRVAELAAGRVLPEPWGHLNGMALAGRPCFLLPGPDADPEIVEEGINFLRNLAASLPVDRA
jgi:hypothetical protein